MSRTRLVIDADIKEEDLQQDPIEVEIPGLGVFEFPGVMPSSAVIRISRWDAAGIKEPSTTQALSLLGDLVPTEILQQWSSAGFDMFAPRNVGVIEKIIGALIVEYQRRDAEIAAAGPAPKRPAVETPPPFSPSGGLSSPTSGASTAPPFPVT